MADVEEEPITGKGTLTKWKQMEAAALLKSVDSMKLDGIPAWKKDLLERKKSGTPGAAGASAGAGASAAEDPNEPEWVRALKERQKRPARPSEGNRAFASSGANKFNTVERSNISLLGNVTIPSEPPVVPKAAPEPAPEPAEAMDACVPVYQPPPQKSEEERSVERAAKKRKVVSFRESTLDIPFVWYEAEYESEEEELSILSPPPNTRLGFEIPTVAATQEETKPMDVTNLEDELAALLW